MNCCRNLVVLCGCQDFARLGCLPACWALQYPRGLGDYCALKWRYINVQPNRSNLSRRHLLATTAASVAAASMLGAGCQEQNKQPAKATKTLAMCGLDCAACPAFIAYRTNDQALRVKTAAEWSKAFKAQLAPEDINCVGCLKTKGMQFSHCRECDIRKCGLAHKVKNCALCPEYSSCEKINKFIAGAPPAKANLEEVRRARQAH